MAPPGTQQRPGQATQGAVESFIAGSDYQDCNPTIVTPDLLARCAVTNRQWGFQEAFEAMSQANSAVAAAGSPYLRSHPRHAALVEQREHVIVTPCTAPSCRGRCSRCARAAAVARNRAQFGQDDFPGTAQAMAVHSAATR